MIIIKRVAAWGAALATLWAQGVVPQSVPSDGGRLHPLETVDELPVVLVQPSLGYRRCLEEADVRGREVLQLIIDTTGHVESGSVKVRQSVHRLLDSLALAAGRAFVFRPARAGGAPVRVLVTLPLEFGRMAPAPTDSGVFVPDCVDREPRVTLMPRITYPRMQLEARTKGETLFEFVVDPEERSTATQSASSMRVIAPLHPQRGLRSNGHDSRRPC